MLRTGAEDKEKTMKAILELNSRQAKVTVEDVRKDLDLPQCYARYLWNILFVLEMYDELIAFREGWPQMGSNSQERILSGQTEIVLLNRDIVIADTHSIDDFLKQAGQEIAGIQDDASRKIRAVVLERIVSIRDELPKRKFVTSDGHVLTKAAIPMTEEAAGPIFSWRDAREGKLVYLVRHGLIQCLLAGKQWIPQWEEEDCLSLYYTYGKLAVKKLVAWL